MSLVVTAIVIVGLCLSSLNILCHVLPACKVSVEESADSFMGAHSYITNSFSCCFKDSLFVLNLWHFNYDVSWYGPLGSSCSGFCTSWTWMCISSSILEIFLVIISSNRFSIPWSLFSLSGTTMMQILLYLMLSQRPLKLYLFKIIFFFLFQLVVFCYLVFQIADSFLCFIKCAVDSLMYSFQLLYFSFLTGSF